MRAKLFLLLVAGVIVAVGAQKTYVGLTNRAPTRVSCVDYLDGKTSAKWLVLTDCEIDLENAIGLESLILKVDKGMYVPVRPAGATAPPRILLKTDDTDPRAGITAADTPAATAARDKPGSLKIAATVEGLVESWSDEDRKARRALDKIARQGTIDRDYVVIRAGKKPDAGDTFLGIFILAATVLAIGLAVRSRMRAARRVAGLTPPPLPPES
jgi:hypothetical protein